MNWNNKNVLVTGIFGFFAPHIAKQLSFLGANIIGSFHDEKHYSFCKMNNLNQKITLAHIDINDINRIKEVICNYEIEYIFHCAANAIVKTCVHNPIGAFTTNIMGTANILEAARNVGGVKGIMCMESDKSYGSFEKNNLPYKEIDAIKPSNVYEISKACSGLVANAYSNNYGMPVFTIRAANLYGPGDMNMSRLIPGSILRILDGVNPVLYSGVANYVREFLYIDDAANASIKLMEKIENTKAQVFNIGSKSVHKIYEVMDEIIKLMPQNAKIDIVEKDPLFKEIEEQYVDFSKLLSIYPDFNPRSLKKGLSETIDWYSKNFNNLPRPS